jgi:hypothetical protein
MGRRRRISGDDPEWEEEILGRMYTITLSTSSGSFRSSVNGDHVSADTKDELVKEIQKRARKARLKVSVPATQIDVVEKEFFGGRKQWIFGVGTRDLVLTGIHSRTGKVLVKYTNGETTQVSGRWGRSSEIVKRLTKAEIEEYKKLKRAAMVATEAYAKFEKKVRLDPEKVVREAMNEAVDDPREDDEDDYPEDPR